MPQRVTIAGGGHVGARAAAILGDYGHDPVVIERDPDRCDDLDDYRHGVVITGDATRPEVLAQADPGRADAFLALTGDDATNRRLCERVDAATDGVRTVARIDERGGDAGSADERVATATAGAKAAADAALGHGHRLHDLPVGGVDLVELDVDPRAPAAHRRLDGVGLPPGSQVVADADAMSVPGPGTELRPGRRYVVAVEPGVADDVRNILRG